MRVLNYFIFVIIFISCDSKGQTSIEGNWVSSSPKIELENYLELYIDSSFITPYSEMVGIHPSIKYSIENDTIYYLFNNKKIKYGLVKRINDSTFSFHNDSILMKRINNGIKLEDMLLNKQSEKDFRNDFLERKRQWLLERDH